MKGLGFRFKVENSLFLDPTIRNIRLRLGANLIRFPWTLILDILLILLSTEFQKSHERTELGI